MGKRKQKVTMQVNTSIQSQSTASVTTTTFTANFPMTKQEQTETTSTQRDEGNQSRPQSQRSDNKNFQEIINSLSQFMNAGAGPNFSSNEHINLSDLICKDVNLKNIFERSLITKIDDKGTSVLHHGSHVPQNKNLFGQQHNCVDKLVFRQEGNGGLDSNSLLQQILSSGSPTSFVDSTWSNNFKGPPKPPVPAQPVLKRRPFKSLFDCSPTLQKVLKEDHTIHALNISVSSEVQQKEKSVAEMKLEVQKLEQWSKGTESVSQVRSLCRHQAMPTSQQQYDQVTEFQINDPRTFFIVNEQLWLAQRPMKLQLHKIIYGTLKRTPFQLMMDVNRCFLTTTTGLLNKFPIGTSQFQKILQELVKIKPGNSDDRTVLSHKKLKEVEKMVKQNIDTSLSEEEERRCLFHVLMQQVHQVRGLLYYRLLKIMVIVGHTDIECCYVMPSGQELATGVLSDDYYQSLIKVHSHKMERRREKFMQYLEWASATFHTTCSKLIRTGICDRLFKQFDFFSIYDKDELSPRARQIMHRLKSSKIATKQLDDFGDFTFRMYQDMSSSDDAEEDQTGENDDADQSFEGDNQFTGHGANRPKSHDYETFIYGFFYFFVLQDPFIRQYLDLKSVNYPQPLRQYRTNLLEDVQVFKETYMLQWVQCMISFGIFESTSALNQNYTNALAFQIHKLYYENLKTAQHWKMSKATPEKAAEPLPTEAQILIQQLATTFYNPFDLKHIPALLPQKEFSVASLKKIEESYLCQQCCSHKMVKMQSTLQGSIDVIQVYVGTQPQVVMPSGTQDPNFQIQSFTCSCGQNSLMTQTDIQGLQRRGKTDKEDRQLFEMMRVGGGMVYRNQKVLQMKPVDLKEDESSEEFDDEKRFITFNQQIRDMVEPMSLMQPQVPVNQMVSEPVITENEKKKRRKKPRRKKKFDKNDPDDKNDETVSTHASQVEHVDQEFEQELILFSQRLESWPEEIVMKRARRLKPNYSKEWLAEVRQRLAAK